MTLTSRSTKVRSLFNYKPTSWPVQIIVASGLIDPDKLICDYTDTELHNFLYRRPPRSDQQHESDL